MKRPWYIWLSVIAFMFMFFGIGIQIIFKKKNLSLWIRFCGKVILLIFSFILLGFIVTFICNSANINLNYITNVSDIIPALFCYSYGVLISYKLYIWKLKNLV